MRAATVLAAGAMLAGCFQPLYGDQSPTGGSTLRTALNYFLEREIDQESKPQQIAAENTTLGPHASPVTSDAHATV